MASQDDDLQASATEGYKIGEKKTVEEYAKLGKPCILDLNSILHLLVLGSHRPCPDSRADQNDESLNRWKASLGISSSPPITVDPTDQRRCVIKTLALEAEGRPDITIDLTTPGSLESLKSKPFSIKEGAKFRMKANFVVQHDVLSGLKYLQVVKRKGIRVAKTEEMLVSTTNLTLTFAWSDCLLPKGLLRSQYPRKSSLRKEM